jgi:two-component system cell cycle sensor histidine kinase PleC
MRKGLMAPSSLLAALGLRVSTGATSFDAALSAVRASLAPTEAEAWRTDAQIRMHRNGSRSSMMLIPVAAFLIAILFAPWVNAAMRFGWAAFMTVLCLTIDQINRRLDRMTGRDARAVGRKSTISTILSVFFVAAWCSMGALFWVDGQPLDQMLLVLVLACSMAGTIALCASHPAIAVATLTIHAAFLIGPAALAHDHLDTMLALLGGMFTVLISGQLFTLSIGTGKLLLLEHERTQLVHNLRAAKSESDRERGLAKSAGRAKSQFLSNMNHELRTPMNAILGFSEIIQSKAFGNDVEKYVEYAGIIHDSGKHLLSLIDDMLDLAKIEAGKLSLKEADVDLCYVIENAIANQEVVARQAQLTLSMRIARGLPRIFADERGIRQIVVNLLSNAIKFTPPEGHVTVFARAEADGGIAFGVEDTGVGIAAEDRDHVFERFGHGRHDITMDKKGTGLGLAIVKGFAEAHDGNVMLESKIGDGTRVTVHIPVDRVIARENTRLSA